MGNNKSTNLKTPIITDIRNRANMMIVPAFIMEAKNSLNILKKELMKDGEFDPYAFDRVYSAHLIKSDANCRIGKVYPAGCSKRESLCFPEEGSFVKECKFCNRFQ